MKSSSKKLILPILIGVVVGAIISSSHLWLRLYIDQRLPNNVEIGGENFSLVRLKTASERLNKKVEEYKNKKIKIKFGEEVAEKSPEEMGVKVFVNETISVVEEGSANSTPLFEFFFPKKKTKVGLILKIEDETMMGALNNKLKLEEIAPKNANFYIEKRKLEIKEGESGYVIDKDKFRAELVDRVKGFKETEITLKKKQAEPSVTGADLEEQKEEMSEKLTYIFTLIDPVFSDNWDERLIDNTDWVIFKTSGGAAEIEINNTAFNSYVDEKISKWLDRPAEEVVLSMDDEGKVSIEGRGNNGTNIDRKLLVNALERAISHKSNKINIPIIETEPSLKISDNLKELGVKERIGIGHTSFYGSPTNRVHNIKTGAAKFNGKLVAPGETFSFNKNLGRVDETTGYKKELVIKPEGTIPEYGGGICQVSTTMYRAVLLSGLKVAERNQHSYAVSYYSQIMGHGLDATIYLGGADMKFVNDTENHILIQAYTKNDYELYFVFYGTQDGRSVEMEGPYISGHVNPGPTIYEYTNELAPGKRKQVEKSHTGFKAKWFRHITDKSGEKTTEPIFTDYKAIQAKILVGQAE